MLFLDLESVPLGVPKDVLVQKLICKHKGLIPDSNVKACVDTRSGKRLYRKRTVVNVAFTGSIPGIVISTGNAK